ncbi:thiamine phosphate synthase [Lichenicoccus sp.]|uniref:thiamine phosphate synthase n=1 Tax=Lichenicoccus sp. TaxID=2781899 RepID=UPI003D1473CB
MKLVLPSRVYPVVDSAGWVERMVASGAKLVQLRIKSDDGALLRREIRAARALCEAAAATLVVNDHWQLAIEAGVGFIHLGQEDLAGADLDAIRGAGARLGVSTHSDAELTQALAVAPDYIALGPIYPTTLKQMPWAPQGLARIASWRQRIGAMPLVAIGGVTLERAEACLEAGADAVAAVSDIVASASPEARLKAWRDRLD